jgi:hypothetical protein
LPPGDHLQSLQSEGDQTGVYYLHVTEVCDGSGRVVAWMDFWALKANCSYNLVFDVIMCVETETEVVISRAEGAPENTE